ncbi:MAG: gliding motility-associated C-terminal domain-containing protein [Sporocytophaga sp.]|uniref:T9SS type B sorting domain-containing protein n=1 Tax=Sporocytophaga sp. TaxID=2231183 RepID=UPI001B10DD08|nr:gliding motility-associated C-terminal domain-containing protein [Sporocytophaga sp.]MBO9699347.1 gliding motility-associated C-terminal domain-containing protein [Sporocytophaga sp.]
MKSRFFLIILLLLTITGLKAQHSKFDWGFSIYEGQGLLQQTNDFVLDTDGSIIATGYYTGSGLDFDPDNTNKFLVGRGEKDIFVAKYNQDGKLIWAFGIGSSQDDEGKSICIDKEGNIYVTGYFQGSNIDVDPGEGIHSLFGEFNIKQTFVAKYKGTDGSLIWSGVVKSSSDNMGIGISYEESGNITLTGNWISKNQLNQIDLDLNSKGYYKQSRGQTSSFISMYSGTTGEIKWGGVITGFNAECEITAHTSDSKGNIYTTGYFSQSVDFDINETVNDQKSNYGSVFLAKFSQTGTLEWINTFQNNFSDKTNMIHDLCIDNSGYITITGSLETQTDIDPSFVTNNISPKSSCNILLAQFDALGTYRWSLVIGSGAVTRGLNVTASSSGTIYLAGVFQNRLDPDPVNSNSSTLDGLATDIVMAKYSQEGKFIWAENIGGNLNDTVSAIAVNGKGKIFIGGAVNGSGNFDPDQQKQAFFSGNNGDLFIAKYDSRIEPVFTFNQLLQMTYGDKPFTLEASVNSGLPITFTSSDTSVVKFSGATANITGAGFTMLTANAGGDENYFPGSSSPRDFTVNKAQQELTFQDIPTKTYGDAPFVPDFKSSAGLPITLYSEIQSIATTSGSVITITGAGFVTISAWCDGDKNYFPSNVVYKILNVNKANQIITFEPLAERTYGEPPFNLVAKATSGLPVVFKSSNNTIATIEGSVITLVGVGTVEIIASQQGNGNYQEAVSVRQTLTIKGPVLSIYGRETVAENTLQVYSVGPLLSGHTYKWSYSDKNVIFTDSTGPSVVIGFNKSSVDGTLSCYIYDQEGIPYDTVKYALRINRGSTVILPGTSCPTSTAFEPCAGGQIDYFSLASIGNKDSGCNPTGYSDYTQSEISTKIFLGDIYSAEIHSSSYKLSSPTYYTAIWIDYNNNGEFDDAGEFLTSSFGKDSVITLQNLSISSNADFAGARRLRVRMRTTGAFTSSQGCISQGETGETEDYLVHLTSHDRLEAPSIITPNNDGMNDFFVIRGINNKEENKLEIFDRFGQVWYSRKSYANNWNGTTDEGQQLQAGTYYYVFYNGDSIIKGFVELKY